MLERVVALAVLIFALLWAASSLGTTDEAPRPEPEDPSVLDDVPDDAHDGPDVEEPAPAPVDEPASAPVAEPAPAPAPEPAPAPAPEPTTQPEPKKKGKGLLGGLVGGPG